MGPGVESDGGSGRVVVAGAPSVERRRALAILRDVREGARADESLDRHVAGLDARQRAFVMELAYGAVRWRKRLDHELGRRLDRGLDSVPPDIRSILQLGVYQIAYMDRVPPWSAVDESVSLARSGVSRRHSGWAPGLVNAVLRNVVREGRLLPVQVDDDLERLAIEHSHPRWIVARWVDRFGKADARALLEHDNRPPPLHLAPNLRVTSPEAVSRELAEAGVEAQSHALKSDALVVERGVRPDTLPGWREGRLWAQDVASQWVAGALGDRQHGALLDACAGPGTKLCAMLSRSVASSALATDVDRRRLLRVRDNRRRLDLGPAWEVVADARRLPTTGTFPVVLADVPCSGSGVLRRRVDARWRRRPDDIESFAGLQLEILEAVARRVAPGGTLLYATCSLEREENEDVVEAFLSRDSRFRCVAVSDDIPASHRQGPYLSTRPWTGDDLDGHFAARMERVVSCD